MAARNISDRKRFVFRAPNRENEHYYVPITRSGSLNIQPSTVSSTTIPSPNVIPPRTERETPVRHVVLIRNTRHPQVNQGSVDLSNLQRSKSVNDSPRLTDGNKSIVLIRRPIAPSEPQKPVEHHSPVQEPSPTPSLEYISTSSPPPAPFLPPEVIPSLDPPQSPNARIKSSKHHEHSPRFAPYLRRPRSKTRTASSDRINSIRQSSSLPRSSLKQEEPQKIDEKRGPFAFYSLKGTNEPVSSPLPAIIEDEQQTVKHRPKEEPLKPIIKRPRSFKRTRFEDAPNDESTKVFVKANRWQTCLSCLSRYMCLILIICLILILIGLAGVGVSAYFLATNSSNNLIPTVVGIVVGSVLAITALYFLCFLFGCIGTRVGGRAFSMTPHDHMKLGENGYPVSRVSTTNGVHRQPSSILRRSNTVSNGYDMKSKQNITIEIPERLLTDGQKSARDRERSLNEMVKNIGQIVKDTKKRYNGDLSDKVIVKVDKNASQTS